MITDVRRPRPKVITVTPYRVHPYDNRREEAHAKRYLRWCHTEYRHRIIDTRIPRPKVFTLTPYTVLPYDDRRKKTQASGNYADAIQSTAI